ncbi:cobalt-precorrin-5B (C(1))-methyltransferase [Rhodobacteraceae bacterium 2CG4]|uniref:Cobalt-precorrin-5B C(1)-methyltransferase n=1 Tax=Halovulum marinum TaxID=2662447 RepID=A0A6L5Z2Z8_9RHOB|nr:cobalt-precorrin-5B (C(1))-methyltransferase [Halovulum marinum]MSU90455.1 cobalt-precorrin-5B (C(1))-methyltransferase [Halovulum marinum]
MDRKPASDLRTGFTTGACATAAAKAAAGALLGAGFSNPVRITLPRGQTPDFELVETAAGDSWASAAVRKDAGDDPDVTHGALIRATVRRGPPGVTFRAGAGVGTVTRPGLPIPPGEPAINPVPRQMIRDALQEVATTHGALLAFEVEISVPGGAELAARTWNPRLGIVGGISILGTTGIVRPFSCAAWIASIHRGIDVARAAGLAHAVGATGATSEQVAQAHYALPDHAMLDMGDFAGGMLKYLARHPLPRVTVAGGFGKLVKLSQGALDLHSARSQVDFAALGRLAAQVGADGAAIAAANTAQQALEIAGPALAEAVARRAQQVARDTLRGAEVRLGVLIVDRRGQIVAETAT